jgi:indoleamine 2,3-dioxygenase
MWLYLPTLVTQQDSKSFKTSMPDALRPKSEFLMFVGDDVAVRCITRFLWVLQEVVAKMKEQLRIEGNRMRSGYFLQRSEAMVGGMWLEGKEVDLWRTWSVERYEREEDDEVICGPTELSGPSAGQNSLLIHSLDIFLGVDKYSHLVVTIGGKNTPEPSPDGVTPQKSSFLQRMQLYMPWHHRCFLKHLASNRRPLRDFLVAHAELATLNEEDKELVATYNAAVKAFKEFRDAHMTTVSLYIISRAAKARKVRAETIAREGEEWRGREKAAQGHRRTKLGAVPQSQTKNAILPY